MEIILVMSKELIRINFLKIFANRFELILLLKKLILKNATRKGENCQEANEKLRPCYEIREPTGRYGKQNSFCFGFRLFPFPAFLSLVFNLVIKK